MKIEVTEPEGRTVAFESDGAVQSFTYPLFSAVGGTVRVVVTALGRNSTYTASTVVPQCHLAHAKSESRDVIALLPQIGPSAQTASCLARGMQNEAAGSSGVRLRIIDDRGDLRTQVRLLAKTFRELYLSETRPLIQAVVLHHSSGKVLDAWIAAAKTAGVPVIVLGEPRVGAALSMPIEPANCLAIGARAFDAAAISLAVDRGPCGVIGDGASLTEETPCLPAGTPSCTSPLLPGVTIRRPTITSVAPMPLRIGEHRTVRIRGLFDSEPVAVRLAGRRDFLLDQYQIWMRPDGDVEFRLPDGVVAGTYTVSAYSALDSWGECVSNEVPLQLDPPERGKTWFVASLAEARFIHDHESRKNEPAEVRFVLGGSSKRERSGNERKVVFPAGPYVGIVDEQTDFPLVPKGELATINPQIPIFWDLKERLGDELQLAVVAYEYDGKSAFFKWADQAAPAIANGISCYQSSGKTCSGVGDIAGGIVAKLEKLWEGEDFWGNANGDHRYGDEVLTCFADVGNYCLGGKSQVERTLVLPRQSVTPDVELKLDLREVAAPRLSYLRVWLENVHLIDGAADDANDAENAEEIWLSVRVAPLVGEDTLNIPFRLPPNQDAFYPICTKLDHNYNCKAGVEWTFGDTLGYGRLYPRDDSDVPINSPSGVPAVYIEIGVWEHDPGGYEELIGVHSNLIWVDDFLGGQPRAAQMLFASVQSSLMNLSEPRKTNADIRYVVAMSRDELAPRDVIRVTVSRRSRGT